MLIKLRSLICLKKVSQLTLLLKFFIVITCSHLITQEVQANEKVKHGIGVSGGYILGTGLTYARYLGPHILQASFIGDVVQYKTDFKAGLSYARYIHHVREPRSMLPVALKFITGLDIHYQDGIVDSDVIVYDDMLANDNHGTYFFHTGAGLGFDIGNPGKPGLVLSLILTYTLSLEEVNNKREWEVSLLPAAGILYNW